MAVEWITAVTFDFRTQLHATILATVALDMKAFVHCDDAYRLFHIRIGYDRFTADGTTWRKFLVITTDAVHVVLGGHRNMHTKERRIAYNADETERMKCFAGCA